jgi:hypothetical protein
MKYFKVLPMAAVLLAMLSNQGCAVDSTEVNGGGAPFSIEGKWTLKWYDEQAYFGTYELTFVKPDRLEVSGGTVGTFQAEVGSSPTRLTLQMNGIIYRNIVRYPTTDSLFMVSPRNPAATVTPASSFDPNTDYVRWGFRRTS